MKFHETKTEEKIEIKLVFDDYQMSIPSLQTLCRDVLLGFNMKVVLGDPSIPSDVKKIVIADIIARHRRSLLEARRRHQIFVQVMSDLMIAVACHHCGSRNTQVCLRGFGGKYCSWPCSDLAENSECFWGRRCDLCRVGRSISLVRFPGPPKTKSRRRKIDGAYWPMLWSKTCDNKCIRERVPVSLPSKNSAWINFLTDAEKQRKKSENLGRTVRRKLF